MFEGSFLKNLVGFPRTILAGMTYGYPSCCISYFANRVRVSENGNVFPGIEDHWYYGTGYIACPECQKLEKNEIVNAINQRRFATKEFPFEKPGTVEIHKAYRHFKKVGVPEHYKELWKKFNNLQKAATGSKRGYYRQRRVARDTVTEAYPSFLTEFLRKNRKTIAASGISLNEGWSFVPTKTCGSVMGMAVLLGYTRGHYIWGVTPGSKVKDEVSDSLTRGFTSSLGHYIPDTPASTPVLVRELYNAIWDDEEKFYDHAQLNEQLEQITFRTSDLNYDFKTKLSGWYDRNCGPELVRSIVRQVFERDYVFMDVEFDLVGPEVAPFEINFYHPAYGWGDLKKFRAFSKANEMLPMDLKIQFYFAAEQAVYFETVVKETIESAIKFAKGEETLMTVALKHFVGDDLMNQHIMAGNYTVVIFEDGYVYFKDDQFQRKLWKEFLTVLNQFLWGLPFGTIPSVSDRLVRKLPSFNQRAVIDVDVLIEDLDGGNIEAMKGAILRSVVEEMNVITPKIGRTLTDEEYMAHYKRVREQTPVEYRLDSVLKAELQGKVVDDDADQAGDENYALEANIHELSEYPVDEVNLLYPDRVDFGAPMDVIDRLQHTKEELASVVIETTEPFDPKHSKQVLGRLNRKVGGKVRVYRVNRLLKEDSMGMAHEIDSEHFAEPCNKGFGDELMAQVRERNENLQAPTEADGRGHLKIISEQGDKALVQKTNFQLYQESGAMGSEKPEPSEPFYVELKTKYDENLSVSEQVKEVDIAAAIEQPVVDKFDSGLATNVDILRPDNPLRADIDPTK